MLKLTHPVHTGRYLPHVHTSYRSLAILLLATGAFLGVVNRASAASGTVDVNGIVSGAAPTALVVIKHPLNGQHFETVPIDVDGTCGAGYIVKIFKNGIFAGSTICQDDGTFALTVDLFPGKNVLTGANYNFINKSGPTSVSVTVYFDTDLILPTPTPTPEETPTPTPTPPLLTTTPIPSDTPTPEPSLSPTASPSPTPAPSVLKKTVDKGKDYVNQVADNLREQLGITVVTPEQQQPADVSQKVVAPAAAVATGVAVPAAAGIINLILNGASPLALLRYLFFWIPRRRRYWGKIYSSNGGLPLVGATVGLVPQELRGKIYQTVTDRFGGYSFYNVMPSNYRLAITAPGFTSFTGEAEHLEKTVVPDERVLYLTPNNNQEVRSFLKQAAILTTLATWMQKVSPFIMLGGILLSLYNVLHFNDRLSWGILAVYGLVGIFELTNLLKARVGGSVVSATGDSINQVIVRVYKVEGEEKELVTTATTDLKGVYSLQVRPGKYILSVEKPGFNTYTSEPTDFARGINPVIITKLEPFSYFGNTYGE